MSFQPKVGDQVTVLDRNEAPVVATVTYTTPSGQFKTDATGDRRFKAGKWNSVAEEIGAPKWASYSTSIYTYTEADFAERLASHQAHESAAAERNRERELKHAERERQLQAQRDEMRRIIPDINQLEIGTASPLPDGSRMYQHLFPSRPRERVVVDDDKTEHTVIEDAGWIWVLISCKTIEDRDWRNDGEMKTEIEAAVSYRAVRGGSFGSCSTCRYATEEEAVYDALHLAYVRL